MTIQSLGYVGIGAPDPTAWAEYARTVIGLAVEPGAASDSGSTPGQGPARYRLRMDQHPFRMWLTEAETGGVTVIGWEVRDGAAIDAMTGRLKEAGVDVTAGTEEECLDRQVTRMVHFGGPLGIRTELFCGRRLAPASSCRRWASTS